MSSQYLSLYHSGWQPGSVVVVAAVVVVDVVFVVAVVVADVVFVVVVEDVDVVADVVGVVVVVVLVVGLLSRKLTLFIFSLNMCSLLLGAVRGLFSMGLCQGIRVRVKSYYGGNWMRLIVISE